GLLLEPADGRVLLPHVVADLRAGHRLAHGRGRDREGVRPQVDDVVHRPTSWRSAAAGPPGGPIPCTSTRRRGAGTSPGSPACGRRSRRPPRGGRGPRG